MGMQAVVMRKPSWQLRYEGLGIGQVAEGRLVPLKGFDKAIGLPVGLRAFNRGLWA